MDTFWSQTLNFFFCCHSSIWHPSLLLLLLLLLQNRLIIRKVPLFLLLHPLQISRSISCRCLYYFHSFALSLNHMFMFSLVWRNWAFCWFNGISFVPLSMTPWIITLTYYELEFRRFSTLHMPSHDSIWKCISSINFATCLINNDKGAW